ncbi:PH domain-containing protein [Candidatus Daviesbacteria bacterium]|nr:PH domain-containing protein [Candidatus Daviesbacteria bacterium]
MFSAYVENPQNCRFEGQDPDEKILLLLRAHPIVNLAWIIPALLLFFLPFFLPKIFSLLNLNLLALPQTFKIVFLIINYLLILTIAFEGFLHWYFNVYIVTDKNVVDVDFHSILFKNIDVAPLRNIEDTSSSMGGILRSIFHYGDVLIQTAGTSRNIDLESVPRPHHVADFILDEAHKLYGRGDRHADGHPS